MFTTVDDRIAFFHPTVAREIEALGLQPGQQVRICKTRDDQKRPCFTFEKLGAQRDGTFVVPKSGGSPSQNKPPVSADSASSTIHKATTSSQDSTGGSVGNAGNGNVGNGGNGAGGRAPSESPYEHSGISLFLREQTNMLTDVFASCVAYAQRYNGAVKPDDVRTLLITTYIQHSKGPRS